MRARTSIHQPPTLFPETNHRRAANEWIAAHPEGFAEFEKMALRAAGRGRRFGAKLLAERVRWERRIEHGEDDFKINNNYVAYIARELIARHPGLRPFVEMRRVEW